VEEKLTMLKNAVILLQTGAVVQYPAVTVPATCVKGQTTVDENGKFRVCSATNTWTIAGTQT
jgi:hypothetical protein